MSVPFYNFNDLHTPEFKAELFERFSKIYDTNGFVEGEYNASFESRFAQMQEAKHCLLVANGTDALEIALEAYGVGQGDKVGVPGITFYATAEAVLNRGAIPVWIDIETESGLICPESTQRVIEQHKLKAIMPVHIYGMAADMEKINSICEQHNVAIIEDAAQAQGAFFENGKPIGSTHNLTTFSFYPTKNLSAFGDAGAILTQSDELALKIKTIRNHGRSELDMLGRNSRCDHMQAAVLDLKLERIEEYNKMRKTAAKHYHTTLKAAELPITLLNDRHLETSSWHLYPIRVANSEIREKLQAHLQKHEIGCTPFYDQAMHQMKVLKNFKEGETKKAEELAGRSICLPMNPFLKEEDIQKVTSTIKAFF